MSKLDPANQVLSLHRSRGGWEKVRAELKQQALHKEKHQQNMAEEEETWSRLIFFKKCLRCQYAEKFQAGKERLNTIGRQMINKARFQSRCEQVLLCALCQCLFFILTLPQISCVWFGLSTSRLYVFSLSIQIIILYEKTVQTFALIGLYPQPISELAGYFDCDRGLGSPPGTSSTVRSGESCHLLGPHIHHLVTSPCHCRGHTSWIFCPKRQPSSLERHSYSKANKNVQGVLHFLLCAV